MATARITVSLTGHNEAEVTERAAAITTMLSGRDGVTEISTFLVSEPVEPAKIPAMRVTPALTRTAKAILRLRNLDPHLLYGYALHRSANINEGSLYPILHRLVDRGWLEVVERIDQTGLPSRKVYVVTPQGEAPLRALSRGQRPQG